MEYFTLAKDITGMLADVGIAVCVVAILYDRLS